MNWPTWQKATGVVVLAVLAVGAAIAWWRLPQPSPPLVIEVPTPASTAPTEMKVYVTGEVVNPGVYAIRPGDRVEEVLRAAGGATARADLVRINLSQLVRDEDHIHVLALPPPAASSPLAVDRVQDTLDTGPPPVDRLDLNRATAGQLEALPGVGPVTAGRILQHRESKGPFRRLEELRDLKLVNQTTFDKIKDLVTVR